MDAEAVVSSSLSLTTLTLFLPMVGLIILLFMNENKKESIRWTAFGFSVATFIASLVMWANYDTGGSSLQMTQRFDWIESLGISYYVGVDGISMFMVLLTTFIMPLAILSSFRAHVLEERGRDRLYFMFMLLLEWAMLGVFVIQDLIIFYISGKLPSFRCIS